MSDRMSAAKRRIDDTVVVDIGSPTARRRVMRRSLNAALLWLLCIGRSFADDSARSPASPVAELRPLPGPLASQPVPQLTADQQITPEAPAARPIPESADRGAVLSVSKVEHLREAARHLEAAGHPEQAKQLQQQADEMAESGTKLLIEKRSALERLQREIWELEQTIGVQPQIVLHWRIMEMNRTRMKESGFNFLLLPANGADVASNKFDDFGEILASSRYTGFVESLVRKGMGRVLAEPTIVTVNGRPASLRCGGEIPVIVPAGGDTSSIRWRETGLSIEAVPICLGGNRLRLDLAAEIAEPDSANAVTVAGNVVPGITTRRINTQIEMKFGETKVIGGLISSRNTRGAGQGDGAGEGQTGDAQETELVVIVTAESAPDMPLPSPKSEEPAVVPAPRR
jgi:Flp pilus assembly secretin CpaC